MKANVQGAKPYEKGGLPMKKSSGGKKSGGINCTKSTAKTWGKGGK